MNEFNNAKTTILMKSFIEDYLQDPSKAIAEARMSTELSWYDNIDEDMIYAELSSPEFRLYEAIIFSQPSGEAAARAVACQ